MRERPRDKDRLEHIISVINTLQREIRNTDLIRLKDNSIVFFGFVKNIEIIGEASYKLSKEFKESHTEVPWRNIEGMRHVLVHGYYAISPEKLWDVVENYVPKLKPIIERYYEELTDEHNA